MACQTGKWRHGLLPLAALWIGANWIETGPIEKDIANRARLALGRVADGAGHPKISGRDLTLEGVIADPALHAAALASVAALAGVRKVTDAAPASAPTASASATAATEATGLASGAAPNLPSAPAAAPVSPPVAAQGPDSGEPRANVDILPVQPQSSPAGEPPAPANPSPPKTPAAARYVLHAEKSQGQLTLTGFYPDTESHAALLAVAMKNFPGLEVIDTMQPGAGAPKVFGEAAVSGLEKLARLREGALDVSESLARLSGEAATTGLADEIRADLVVSLPSGFAVDTLLTAPASDSPARELPAPEPEAAGAQVAAPPPEPPAAQPAAPMDAAACQAQMAALVKDRPIEFASGSARILPDSVPTLRALAEAASKCPQVNFEIAGHTDDVGLVSRNEDLSRRRAESVLVYLVASGVAPRRLSAAGHGESRPLVPNDNDENRAKNRRIEFNVK